MKQCPTCQTSYPNNFMVCPQDGVQLVEAGSWADGSVIRGKYRIISKVGQGGMGTVYKVVHVAFEEVHALKVILPALMSDDLFVKRFKHEAVITRKLQHPHAVRVDDIDEAEDGRPIIVMEYIEGQSLKKLIQEQGALPVPRVCSIIKQAAAALQAAHDLGMVHRDIKPDNIVLVESAEGEMVKVLDFGIAKVKEARNTDAAGMTLTGTGVVIGTPQYMSPEQAMGKRGDELNGRSDIYSLGVVMYQMLTGDLPFKADTTMGMLLAHMQSDPTPIRVIHPELQIPEPIANVVMRTLEKDPDNRPQTANALIQEIEDTEKISVAPMGETRVFDPAQYSPQDSARRLRESLRTTTPPKIQTRRQVSSSDATSRPMAAEPVSPQQDFAPSPPRPAPAEVRPSPPPPPPRPVVVPVPPRKSSAGLWVVVGILAILLVAGGGYLFLKSSNSGVIETPPVNPHQTQGDDNQTGNNAKPDQPKDVSGTDTGKQAQDNTQSTQQGNNGGQTGANDNSDAERRKNQEEADRIAREREARKREDARRQQQVVPPKHTVDPAAISSAIKLGDFYLSRGEYDNAIAEFQKGLVLDPSNSTLLDRLNRAKKAKAAESRVLN